MAILSVQSHVAYGRVGNRAAVFPLELLGFDVWPVNTVQFSNHTGYPGWRGEVFSHRHIEQVWMGIRDLGVLGECEAVLSGYLGDASLGHVILEAAAAVKAARPDALYCCDPVLGDYEGGLYVREGISDFMRSHALPVADIVTPNQFEAEILSGVKIGCPDDARRAAAFIHERGPRIVLVTSFEASGAREDEISLFLSDGGRSFLITTPRIAFPVAPNGAGDLSAALFLGHYLRTRDAAVSLALMANTVFSVLERTRTEESRELRLVSSADAIRNPLPRYEVKAIG